MDIDEGPSRVIQACFITKLHLPQKLPSASIFIPSNLTRMGLSAVLNNLFKAANSDWDSEPFDFLIHGELVRMSLEQFLLAKGIPTEKTLEIEYIKAVAPRKKDHSFHDDWVAAVNGSYHGLIFTGCYDGLGRAWKTHDRSTHILQGHSDGITSIVFINSKDTTSAVTCGDICLATASKDRTVRLWKFDPDVCNDDPVKVRPSKIFRGHNASVQSVAADPSGNMVCSGSWDCTIKLWKIHDVGTEGETVSIKKRKASNDARESVLELEAAGTFTGHAQCVSSVVWPERQVIYSASWDHSIRRLDVETGKDLMDIYCAKALNCLDVGGESSALIVAGGSDPVLRVWDPRKPGTSAPTYQFASHGSWISACKWHRKSWFHLVSASYDGKVMLWDLRTAWPLSVIDTHKDRVLCVDWWKDDNIVSGGTDSMLCLASGIPL